MNAHQKQLAQLAFLTATAQHFTSDNRGIELGIGNTCSYKRCCAIGRHLRPVLRRKLDDFPEAYNSPSGTGVGNDAIFNLLPKKLQALGQIFLMSVQNLHDKAENWDNFGLSGLGRTQFNRIVRGILGDKYK